jgi:hypothetical protein
MYGNPEAYHLPVMKIEEFLNGRDLHDVKRESLSTIKKLNTQTKFSAVFYIDLLYRIGSREMGATLYGNSNVISDEQYQYASKRIKSVNSPIPLGKRLEALSRVGLEVERLPSNEYRFTSKNYPDMFAALSLMPWDNLNMLDFRNIYGKHKPNHDDLFYPLPAEQREIAYELHNFAKEMKMKAGINANNGVTYAHNGKQRITLWTGSDVKQTSIYLNRKLCVSINVKNQSEPHIIIEDYLKNEPPDFREHILSRLDGCDSRQCIMCSTFSSGNYVEIFGKRHQICGDNCISINWHEPKHTDIDYIKKMIGLRCANI